MANVEILKRNNSKARPIIAQEAGGAPPSLTRQENHTSKRKRVVNFCAVITSLESVGWTGREMRGAWGVGGGGEQNTWDERAGFGATNRGRD